MNRDYVDRVPVSGLVHPSDINQIRSLYCFNSSNIEKYYKDRNFAVKNTHIISRILELFPTYINYDPYRYVEYSLDKIKYLAKHFKFTSDIERGIVHPGYFFGNDSEEILLATYENFNVNQVVGNWKNTKAITILQHQRNDTKLLLPLGNDDGCKSGLASLLINIPMLALQYRQFNIEQATKNDETDMILNKNHFVIKYVLSNMMPELIDHTLLNMVMDRFYGIETVTPKFKHRFKIFEPTTQLNRYVDQTLDVITNKNLDFVNILHNIQLVSNIDASSLLCLPEIPLTQQVKTAIVISRLKHLIFLCDVAKSKSLSSNRHYINDWKRLATRLSRDSSIFEDMFSYKVGSEIKEQLYKLRNM